MGLTDVLRGRRLYFDTNVFIYLLEGSEQYQALVDELAVSLARKELRVTSSLITLTEILPPLVKRADEAVLSGVLEFLRDSDLFTLVSVDEDIALQAGFLRGELGMKTPDALHVATAICSGCDVFLTNDSEIRVPQALIRVLLSEHQ